MIRGGKEGTFERKDTSKHVREDRRQGVSLFPGNVTFISVRNFYSRPPLDEYIHNA